MSVLFYTIVNYYRKEAGDSLNLFLFRTKLSVSVLFFAFVLSDKSIPVSFHLSLRVNALVFLMQVLLM